ncbi:sensor histidine kinase [Spirosoma koreense]
MPNPPDGKDQAFLLKLSDTLRAETGVKGVGNRATQLIAKRLGADRVYLVTINPNDDTLVITHETRRPDMPPLLGTYRGSEFPSAIKEISERTIVYTDVRTDDRLTERERLSFAGLGAVGFMAASVRRGSQIMIWAAGVVSSGPRAWTASEVVLFEDAIERTWAAVERARAEQALRDSEARLQLALNAAELGTFIWHVAEDRTEEDALARVHFGLPPVGTVSLAEALVTTFHPDDAPRYAAAVVRAIDPAGSGTLHEEFRVRHPDGRERWLAVNATTAFEGTPPVAVRLTGVLADVTERKQADESLRRVAQTDAFRVRLSDALSPLSNSVQIQQAVTQIALDHFGADRFYYCEIRDGQAIIRRDAARQDLPSVTGVYDLTSMPMLTAVIETGRPFIVNDVHTTNLVDESLRRLCIQLAVISFIDIPVIKEGRPVGVLCVVQDKPRQWTELDVALAQEVAERTWVAVERARAEEALRQADRRKDEFLAMLAHELRNPLAPVRNGLQLLAQTQGQEQFLSTMLPIMNRQMDHLMRMLDDLLDVSRISQGKIQLHKQRIDLTLLVNQTVQAMQPVYTASSRRLSAQLPDYPLYLDGDGTRLNQVVANLLSNGLRYTHEGGHVWLSLERLNERAVLRVSDNGIGLAADQLGTIFELFVQVDTSLARSHGGLGVGLALVQQLVQLHGGRVEAHSPGLEQGSEFVVYLPILLT